MQIIAKNITTQDITITDLSGIIIPASGQIDLLNHFYVSDISNSSELPTLIAFGSIVINDGENDLTVAEAIKYVTVHINIEKRDRSGKLRTQNTPRPLGLKSYWTGRGDDITNPTNVGDGNIINLVHNIGDPVTQSFYVDFNCVENETWIYEGYAIWQDAVRDLFSFSMVPVTVSYQAGTNTNYNIYGGAMIVPANGTGNVEILSDLTLSNGGLVYAPNNDLNEPPTAFWNADWNTSTKKFENITPAPLGNGRYNIFTAEVTFVRFINCLTLSGTNKQELTSFDVDQLGHGIRLKGTLQTVGDDHQWSAGGWIMMYRRSTK